MEVKTSGRLASNPMTCESPLERIAEQRDDRTGDDQVLFDLPWLRPRDRPAPGDDVERRDHLRNRPSGRGVRCSAAGRAPSIPGTRFSCGPYRGRLTAGWIRRDRGAGGAADVRAHRHRPRWSLPRAGLDGLRRIDWKSDRLTLDDRRIETIPDEWLWVAPRRKQRKDRARFVCQDQSSSNNPGTRHSAHRHLSGGKGGQADT